jgi:hypothetical protein
MRWLDASVREVTPGSSSALVVLARHRVLGSTQLGQVSGGGRVVDPLIDSSDERQSAQVRVGDRCTKSGGEAVSAQNAKRPVVKWPRRRVEWRRQLEPVVSLGGPLVLLARAISRCCQDGAVIASVSVVTISAALGVWATALPSHLL